MNLHHAEQLREQGFTVINEVYDEDETDRIIRIIEESDASSTSFRKAQQVYAIRKFLKEIPASSELIFNKKLIAVIHSLFGKNYFVVKSIYFDKPEQSNWFVPYHQDLMISVTDKTEVPGFGPWTQKNSQYNVQPPAQILENVFTVRIHLDDTNEKNGALKIIPGSHKNGITRSNEQKIQNETICSVKRGGVMIMKPLLFHSSERSTEHNRRRVIHIEFSSLELPTPLQWNEKKNI